MQDSPAPENQHVLVKYESGRSEYSLQATAVKGKLKCEG